MSMIRGHFNFHSGGHLFSSPENCFHMSQKDFLFLHEKSVNFFLILPTFLFENCIFVCIIQVGIFCLYNLETENEKKYLEK